MKLLQVAFAGILGLAGLAAGASNDKAYEPHLDDNIHNYYCDDLDITQCRIHGSCSPYEHCAHWCIDLKAPGGAICAKAPPKSVEARDDGVVAWQNDGQHRYVCQGLDIAEFDIRNNFRKWVERCEKNCDDTNHGARCIGRVHPPPNRPPPEVAWDNDEYNKYICIGLNIERCNPDATHCARVQYCEKGCFDTGHGALCVDKVNGPPPKHDARDESNSASTGAVQSTRKCSGTRRGVLTCNEGFCSVHPGDWCKSGQYCHDDCTCCKNGRKRDGLAAEALESTAEAQPLTTKLLHKMSDCVPGQYWCHPIGNNYLLICDNNAKWAISADCGMYGPYGCCRGTAWPGPDHRCDCRPGPPALSQGKTEQNNPVAVRSIKAVKAVNETITPSPLCKTGEYMCSPFKYGLIVVCDYTGTWQVSADCGKTSRDINCCRQDPGSPPFCDCRGLPGGPPGPLISVNQATTPTPPSVKRFPKSEMSANQCIPGQFSCDLLGTKWIYVCNSRGHWTISSSCGEKIAGVGCCRPPAIAGASPTCDCKKLPGSPAALSKDDDHDEMIARTNQTKIPNPAISKPGISSNPCAPGQFWCSPGNEWIMVCDIMGRWTNSSYCGKTKEGFGCCRGSSVPGAPPTCDCRGLPGGSSALSNSDDNTKTVARRSIENPEEVLVEPPERCTPGTFRCKPPFTQGWLQVCGPNRIWYLANQFCGPYTCFDIPGDEPPHCECGKKSRSLEIDSTSSSNKAATTSRLDKDEDPNLSGCNPGTYSYTAPDTAPLMVCNPQGQWKVSDTCCGVHTYCNCPHVKKSLPVQSLSASLVQPTSRPEDPDEPEFCSPGRFTCGDSGRKVYACNIKGNWELSATCTSDHVCAKGLRSEAYCVKTTWPANDVGGIADKGSTTLLTVAKEAASSTAKA